MVVVPAPGGAIEQDGCPTAVSELNVVENGQSTPFRQFGAATQGWFALKRGHRVQIVNIKKDPYTGQNNGCLQGLVIGFGQFGNSCPGNTLQTVPAFPDPITGLPISPPILLPNGSNSFEPTLNLPHKIKNQPGGGNIESVDISCVNGANSTIQVQLTPPANGPYWVYNGGTTGGGNMTFKTTTSGQNSWVNIAGKCDNNCLDPATNAPRPGVYPYGCTMCNVANDPNAPCRQQFCHVNNGLPNNTGCGFNRGPIGNQQFGGDIVVNYMGPLSPPPSCN
jgi:hypothetical protein